MLTALYVVLSILTPIKLLSFKFTFEAFPILIAGILFGPLEGLAVGTVGSGIYQVFLSSYGITPTTPLWILPHAFSGFLVGMLTKAMHRESYGTICLTAVLSAFSVTLLNTLALYVDSKMYGYYSYALVFGTVIWKLLTGAILAALFAAILPKLLSQLRKIVK